MIKSELTGKEYNEKNVIRLVNTRQIATYCLYGAQPIDIYASRDFRTNEPILVALFDKDETKDLYEKWNKFELK